MPSVDRGKFVTGAGGVVVSQCLSCSRLRTGPVFACDAFPAGIPDGIVSNVVDHRTPARGDHDLRFDPIPGVSGAYLENLAASFGGGKPPGKDDKMTDDKPAPPLGGKVRKVADEKAAKAKDAGE